MNALGSLGKKFLVSAYDISKSNELDMMTALKKAIDNGSFILMDSGNYESFWHDDQSKWTQKNFHNVMSKFPAKMAFSFDNQSPPRDMSEHQKLLKNNFEKDFKFSEGKFFVPIIHGTSNDLPKLCFEFVLANNVRMISIAERELGEGIIERFETIKKIRTELNKLADYIFIHVLGTGNPISLALFSYAGADSFDGLEWCQTSVCQKTKTLFHFSQGELLLSQTAWGEMELPYNLKVLAHNLEFYEKWMISLRQHLQNNTFSTFVNDNFPSEIKKAIEHAKII